MRHVTGGARASVACRGSRNLLWGRDGVLCTTRCDEAIGALRHLHQPRAGRQLHPGSILTKGSTTVGCDKRVAVATGIHELWLELDCNRIVDDRGERAAAKFRSEFAGDGKWS